MCIYSFLFPIHILKIVIIMFFEKQSHLFCYMGTIPNAYELGGYGFSSVCKVLFPEVSICTTVAIFTMNFVVLLYLCF